MKKTFTGIFVLFIASIILFPDLLLAYTGEVIQSFNTPGKFPTGMTFDGENLWLADRKADKLFCINPKNGKVIRSIPSPAYWPTGLAWDGEALWNADVKGGIPLSENYNGVIYRLDPKDGTILKVVQSPTSSPRGLCWDGEYLWCVDDASDELIQFSPDDGTTIRSLKSPSVDPRGLTFDGKYLWVSDRIRDEIYMVDPESGCVIIITETLRGLIQGVYVMPTRIYGQLIQKMIKSINLKLVVSRILNSASNEIPKLRLSISLQTLARVKQKMLIFTLQFLWIGRTRKLMVK